MQKHKFAAYKKEVPDKKMIQILTDVFLMESYVNEKAQGVSPDSLTVIKQSFYLPILRHHKVDSASFFNTFNYFQSNPKEYAQLLSLVDSNMIKIKPLDTTIIIKPAVVTPKNIDILPNFKEQEQAMGREFLKGHSSLQKLKLKKSENKQQN